MNPLLAVIGASQRWSVKTQLVYENAVGRFLAFAGDDLTGVAVERWRDHLLAVAKLEGATVHKLVAAIKAVSRRHAALTGGLDFARAAELPKLDQWRPPSPPTVTDVSLLLDHAARDASPLGLRDRPVVRLMALAAGERLGEVIGHRIRDFRGQMLSIHRKGGWNQDVHLDDETSAGLTEWLQWRGGSADDPMFTVVRRSLADTWEQTGALTPAGLAGMLRRRCAAAGIRRVIRPHDLRRFFISALLESGAGPHEAMLAAAHKSLHTTSRYIGRVTDSVRPPADRIASALLTRKEIP